MFGVYDYFSKGFISFIDCEGYAVGGRPIFFETVELAEAFIVWFSAMLGVDEESFVVSKINNIK